MISNMSMHSHIQKWDLHDADAMPETRTSKLCRVTTGSGEQAVLKFLKPAGVLDEAGGAAILEYYSGLGAVRIIEYDTEAHLLEYADSHDLLYAIDHGIATDEEAAQIAADIVAQLHTSRIGKKQPEGLIPLRTRFNALYDKAAADRMAGNLDSVFVRAAALADHLLETTAGRDVIPLHGDLHHENIVHSTTRGWLAIDPKGLIGDRAYDVSNLFCNPLGRDEIVERQGRIDRLADIFSRSLGYDRVRILGFGAVHCALSATWSLLEDRPAEAAGAVKIAQALLASLPESFKTTRDAPRALEPAA